MDKINEAEEEDDSVQRFKISLCSSSPNQLNFHSFKKIILSAQPAFFSSLLVDEHVNLKGWDGKRARSPNLHFPRDLMIPGNIWTDSVKGGREGDENKIEYVVNQASIKSRLLLARDKVKLDNKGGKI